MLTLKRRVVASRKSARSRKRFLAANNLDKNNRKDEPVKQKAPEEQAGALPSKPQAN